MTANRYGKDVDLIVVFLLLGLASLAGGIAAIVDGLPYLVLERGFTQVIIGSTLAAAGMLMLALAWVLVELRRLRRDIVQVQTRTEVVQMPVGQPATMPGREPSLAPPVVAGAGAAAVAGALLGTAASEKLEPSASEGQNDLFGSLVASRFERTEPAFDAPQQPASEEPGRETFVASPAEHEAGQGEPELVPAAEQERTVEAALFGLDETVAEPEPAGTDRGEAEISEVALAEVESTPADQPGPVLPVDETYDDLPEPAEAAEPVEAAPAPADELPAEEAKQKRHDPIADFDDLRLSLEDRLRQLDMGGPGFDARTSSAEGQSDPLDAASSWMARPFEQPASDAGTADADVESDDRLWGAGLEKVAEAASPETVMESDAPAPADDHWSPLPAEAAPLPAEPVEPVVPDADLASPPAGPLSEPGDTPEQPVTQSAPEASEEGIVGAYQVGDTHFTIYADGSIQARTPDGDYSFGSMDELKLFLASERNRLGV